MLRRATLLALLSASGLDARAQQAGQPVAGPRGTWLHEHLDQQDARWHNTIAIDDGVKSGAARFDGRNSHIDLGPLAISSREPFTLRCSLRTTNGNFCTPLMARDGERVALSLVMGRQPGCISFEAWSWQSVKLIAKTRLDDGAWHAIEVTHDPASNLALVFVDGNLEAYAELGEGASPTAQLRLGNNIGSHQPFAGDIDEVEIIASTTHAESFPLLRPVLTASVRQQALAEVRERALPKATPSLATTTAAAWPARRAAVRQHVTDALGLAPPPAAVPFDVQVDGEIARDGVRLQRVSWIGFPGMRATGWLWLPDPQPPGRLPTVLCPHGHWAEGARDPVVQARCAAFAKFGWLCLAIDSVHVEHIGSGVNSVGAMTWHNQRAIGWLAERDDVDATRIATTGASGGGQQSFYLMALEDRLAAAAPMVMACYLNEILSETSAHCGCNHVPRLAARTDVPEMCAVFAPRPVMFGSVTGDWTHNFPREGLPELRAHWQRLGGAEPRSRHADEGHNFDRPMREEVYGFLHDVFLGSAADGLARHTVAEPAFAPFSQVELEPLLRARPPVRLDAKAMADEYLTRRPRVDSLATLAPGLDFDIPVVTIDWCDAPTARWRRGSVRGADGVPIPFRMAPVENAAVYTVIVDPAGMAARLAKEPEHAPLPGTVLVDPRPYGEWQPFRAAWQRNGIFLGRGEGYQAAIDVALVCTNLPGSGKVRLIGRGEASVVALLAAHLCPRIEQLVTDALEPTYAQNGNRWPLCPELLRFRDLPELVRSLPAGVLHRFATAATER